MSKLQSSEKLAFKAILKQLTKLSYCPVDIEVIGHAEDAEVRGNAMASGDAEVDRLCEDGIIDQLENGNEWAWCCIEVKVKFLGLEASDSLGGCSYKSEQDFIDNSGYFDDMVNTCVAEIIGEI